MSLRAMKNLTVYDVLIIASMIDREVQVAKERELVAAVIYNRLARRNAARDRRDDPLRGRQLHRAADRTEQLDSTSPYNTRLNAGLPPGPIGNPGLAAIEAAAHPGQSRLHLLRGQAGDLRRAHLLLHEAEFDRDVGRLPAGPRGAGRLAGHLLIG